MISFCKEHRELSCKSYPRCDGCNNFTNGEPVEVKEIDRYTALEVLKEFARDMYPSTDIFGHKTLVISRKAFEAIRHKYLDRRKET